MRDFIYQQIGELKSLSGDFVAHDGTILFAISYWDDEASKTVRFVSFVSSSALSYFEQLTPDSKVRCLFNNELSKDELSLMLCEYRLVSFRYKI